MFLFLILNLSLSRLASTLRNGEVPKPISLSEITDDEGKAPAWIAYQEEQKGNAQPGLINAESYEDFIDVEGFDGGDGQVGAQWDAVSFNRTSLQHEHTHIQRWSRCFDKGCFKNAVRMVWWETVITRWRISTSRPLSRNAELRPMPLAGPSPKRPKRTCLVTPPGEPKIVATCFLPFFL